MILYTEHWERGPGVFFGLGWEIELTPTIDLNITPIISITRIKEYKYEFSDPFIWFRKTNFNFSGLFVKGILTFNL